MSRPVQVLVVDDSVVIRRLVSKALQSDPEIRVCGVANNGRAALDKVGYLQPDVVVLDVEMPVMNGLETLRELRRSHPFLPVIMFSALTERGGAATLEALSLGASDYVTKPSSAGTRAGAEPAMDKVRAELLPKVRTLGRAGGETGAPTTAAVRRAASPVSGAASRQAVSGPGKPEPLRVAGPVEVLAIGCSTGGPQALTTVLGGLPADLPVPVVITQHMPPVFTRLLAERLDSQVPLSVREAQGGETLEPGQAWIAPGGQHLVVEPGSVSGSARLVLSDAEPENSCRPAVDPMFRSLAAVYGGHVLAAILTGMGKDGLRGAQALSVLGARIVCQDEETSVVWGMPGYVAKAGLAERTLPLDQIAPELVRLSRLGRKSAGLSARAG